MESASTVHKLSAGFASSGLMGFVGLTVSGPHPAMISNTLENNVLTINPLQEFFDGFVNTHTGNNSSNSDALANLAADRIWSFSSCDLAFL